MKPPAKNTLIVVIGGVALTAALFLPLFLLQKIPQAGELVENSLLPASSVKNLKEASWYTQLANGLVQCNLCPNNCLLKPSQRGLCKARENINGKLYALNYGLPVSVHLDPIEKKPFFHFLPGSEAFSLAAAGCNFSCLNCQNWQISQQPPESFSVDYLTPEQVVQAAFDSGAKVIAYTYSEPISFYDYMLDIAKLAKQAGLKNVMVSNGYINPEPLKELLPYLDAVKIDLKGFSEDFYQKITGGKLQPVLETIKIIKNSGKHLEITNLLIPGENDSEKEIRAMVKWLKENVGEDTILHFSRFHPDYKLQNLPPTPVETVEYARQIALEEGLKYVYTGNIYFPEGEATFCPDGSIGIKRQGFFVMENNLKNGKCPDGTAIPGIWVDNNLE